MWIWHRTRSRIISCYDTKVSVFQAWSRWTQRPIAVCSSEVQAWARKHIIETSPIKWFVRPNSFALLLTSSLLITCHSLVVLWCPENLSSLVCFGHFKKHTVDHKRVRHEQSGEGVDTTTCGIWRRGFGRLGIWLYGLFSPVCSIGVAGPWTDVTCFLSEMFGNPKMRINIGIYMFHLFSWYDMCFVFFPHLSGEGC